MSKYMVDKLIRAVELSDAALAQYVADPEAFVRGWLCGGGGPEGPADDRVLTAEEYAAFAGGDYGELYRLGAHPYLLWHFTEAIRADGFTAASGWRELVEEYRATIAQHGAVDYIP
jgi:hypothetical protein